MNWYCLALKNQLIALLLSWKLFIHKNSHLDMVTWEFHPTFICKLKVIESMENKSSPFYWKMPRKITFHFPPTLICTREFPIVHSWLINSNPGINVHIHKFPVIFSDIKRNRKKIRQMEIWMEWNEAF